MGLHLQTFTLVVTPHLDVSDQNPEIEKIFILILMIYLKYYILSPLSLVQNLELEMEEVLVNILLHSVTSNQSDWLWKMLSANIWNNSVLERCGCTLRPMFLTRESNSGVLANIFFKILLQCFLFMQLPGKYCLQRYLYKQFFSGTYKI